MSPILSKTTVAQCDLGRISSIGKVVHGLFYTGFGFLTIRVNLKLQFSLTGQLRMQFPQALASSQYGPISSKTTVAQSVLMRILSNRTIAHGVLDKF